jgi:hypothetical protein
MKKASGLETNSKMHTLNAQKMKVNLATQTFSSSVADAIEYCTNTLKLPQFQGSAATVQFIRTIDHLFDFLNSSNPCAKGYKAALRKSNEETWKAFLDEAYMYIIGLRDASDNLMYTTRRKTGFIGFLVAIKSIKAIFHNLVGSSNAPVNYILTYKFSQDHLELFFCAIRSSGGFNNNPVAQQFTAAYKRFLLKSSIEGNNGNCQKQNGTDILEASGNSCKIKEKKLTVNDAAIIRKYDLQGQLDPQCKR